MYNFGSQGGIVLFGANGPVSTVSIASIDPAGAAVNARVGRLMILMAMDLKISHTIWEQVMLQ